VSRLSALAAHPRRTLGALAVVLAAVGITVGSGANFTASSANPSNVFTTGTLSIDNSKNQPTPSAILNASGMKPGDSNSGTVDIANTGSLSGAFTLSGTVTDANGGSLSNALTLKIDDCGSFATGTPNCTTGVANLYTGTLKAFTSTIPLSTFAPNAKHRYQFTVALPSAVTDNTLQGASSTAVFTWNATSL
jgi:spore coat-associated protein N